MCLSSLAGSCDFCARKIAPNPAYILLSKKWNQLKRAPKPLKWHSTADLGTATKDCAYSDHQHLPSANLTKTRLLPSLAYDIYEGDKFIDCQFDYLELYALGKEYTDIELSRSSEMQVKRQGKIGGGCESIRTVQTTKKSGPTKEGRSSRDGWTFSMKAAWKSMKSLITRGSAQTIPESSLLTPLCLQWFQRRSNCALPPSSLRRIDPWKQLGPLAKLVQEGSIGRSIQQLQHTLVALDGFPVLKTRHLKIRQHPSIVFCALCCRTSHISPGTQDQWTATSPACQALLADETKDSDLQRDLAALPGQPRYAKMLGVEPWQASNMIKSHDVTGHHGTLCKLQNDAKRC